MNSGKNHTVGNYDEVKIPYIKPLFKMMNGGVTQSIALILFKLWLS